MRFVLILLILLGLLGCQASGGGGGGGILSPTANSNQLTLSTTLNKTYKAGDALDLIVRHSRAINVSGLPAVTVTLGTSSRSASYVSGSGSTSLLFRYIVAPGDLDLNGIVVSPQLDVSGGSITCTKADGSSEACPSSLTISSTTSVRVDADTAAIVSVTAPTDGTYYFAQTLLFQVTFSEPVTVSRLPRLPLTVGGNVRHASYVSGSGSDTLNFLYAVALSDVDADGIAVSGAIDLNGGSIRDASYPAALTFTAPDTSAVLVSDAPVITFVTPPAAGTYNLGQDLTFRLNFSKPVTVSSLPGLVLDVGGTTQYASYVSGSGSALLTFQYTVAGGVSDTDGIELSDTLDLSTGTITDGSGVSARPVFMVPTLANVNVLGDGSALILSVAGPPSPPVTGYKTGDSIPFTVTFSQPVTETGGTSRLLLDLEGSPKYATYFAGSGSSILTYRYVVQAGDYDPNGVTVSSPLDLDGSTVTSGPTPPTLTFTPPNTSTVKVDALGPSLLTNTVPSSQTYTSGEDLVFDVTFDEAVVVSGSPRLQLDVGGITKYATLLSGSGTPTLRFRYQVGAADEDLDGIGLAGAIDLNGSTIRDANTNSASLTLPTTDTSGVLIESPTPTILSASLPPAAKYETGEAVDLTVTFSEAVIVTSVPRIELVLGSGTVYADYVSGGGTSSLLFRYTVTAGDYDTDGPSVSSPIDLSGGSIKNVSLSADALLTFTPPVDSAVLVDGIEPVLSSVTGPAPATYKIGDGLNFSVTYDHPVTVTGTPRLAATIGSGAVFADYVSGSGTTSLTFQYTVASGDEDTDGISWQSPIDLAGGSITDLFGDAAPVVFTDDTDPAVTVDGIRPTITSVTGPAAGTYDAPQTLDFTVTFSEPIDIQGTPRIAVAIGSEARTATLASFTGDTATFSYTLLPSDTDADGLSLTASVELNGGQITDVIGNQLTTLTFTAPDLSSVLVAGNVPVAANSQITGTTPVVADGVSEAVVTIELRNASNNPVTGVVPTFVATDTGSTNIYGACSVSDGSGISTCALSSLAAESKILELTSPISKTGQTLSFTAGSAVASTSTITGTGPVVADGSAVSTVTITLRDVNSNPVVGQTPTFSATDTGTTNSYGACSTTDATGAATCTLSSTKAELKTLELVTPVSKTGGSVSFVSGPAASGTSTITGVSPVTADGVATGAVSIVLLDANGNPVSGVVPTFSATDTGSTNAYGTCSATDATGASACTISSQSAEVKTLSLVSPLAMAGGTVTFSAGPVVASTSTITGTGPVVADGVATSTVTVTLRDAFGNPVSGITPDFSATDTGGTNTYGSCSTTTLSGASTCTLSSLAAESKTLSITSPVTKNDGTVTFTAGTASAANSSITGTGPVVANGTASSTVTITLRDTNNNPITGVVPTFSGTDTASGNTYGPCSATSATGLSTCLLRSTRAEVKTLQIETPIVKADGSVTFTAGSAFAGTSSITGTGPVIADGVSTSTVTITLRDSNNNPVSGATPTFAATNSGSTNTYGTCSATSASGESSCTLASTKAEIKTLSIATPVSKADGTVTFTAGAPSAANSDIIGTSPVSADGVSVSFITVSLADAFGNPIEGVTPIFNATDTDSTNAYGACTATTALGSASCSLAATRAEVKTLQMTSPIAVTGSSPVTFSALLPTSANSSITGTSPVVADGGASSTVTITLRDSSNNAVAGIVPTFDATDTDSRNVYDSCSMSDAGGVAICTFASTRAEDKILRITNPVTKSGSTVTFVAGAAIATNSSISGTGPVIANGTASSTISISLADANNNPVSGVTPTFSATNTGTTNTQTACSVTNAAGASTCTLSSTKAESKVPQLLTPVSKSGSSISFVPGPAAVATSTITGTGPVNPDGTSTSTISITIKDAFSNPISSVTPTFSASGSSNTYGACSATAADGSSTCTLSSSVPETKTLSIVTPVSKADGSVVFQSGAAVAINSSISSTGPVLANGSDTSTITVTLRDSTNAPVIASVPTITATGTSNTIGTCSATNASGVSTCTLASTKAELKSISISAPISKLGPSVEFTPGPVSALTSTIVATDPNLADGSTPAEVTITLRDAFGNAISGLTPTYSVSGTSNTLGDCTATDSAGEAVCEVTSTKAEGKTFSLLTPVAVTGNTVDFNPSGIDLVVPVEMIDRGLASNTTAINFLRSRTSINPADYVGESSTYSFEIIADNTNTTTAYSVSLINGAGTTISDSTISIPPSTSQRRFSVVWTPSVAADTYRIRVPATAAANQVRVHSAKILIQQTNAVASRIYIPLIGGDVTGETNSDTTGNVSSTTSTTFVLPTASNFYFWTRSDAAYDAIPSTGTPWTLETISSISNAASTVTVALFDKTNNLQITPATTTVTGATTVTTRQVNFAGNATNFEDGDVVEVRLRSSNTAHTARLFKAGLWLKLKYLKKAEVYQRLATRRSATTTATIPDHRFLWDASAWQNPTVYFQAWSNTTTSAIVLMTNGAVDTGVATPTTVSTITPAATYTMQRSAALSLTNLNRYWVQQTRTAGTAVLGGAFMVIRVTE